MYPTARFRGNAELDTPGPAAPSFGRAELDAPAPAVRLAAGHHPLDVGRRTRTIPPALRRTLLARDRACRFPGCAVRFVEGHHIRHWAEGGPTTMANLALLCRRHHRAVHEEGFQVERGPAGQLRFRRPDGRPLPDVPPRPAVPADPVAAIRTRHEAAGLRLHARTACPAWLGERLDLGWALDVVHPLAQRT